MKSSLEVLIEVLNSKVVDKSSVKEEILSVLRKFRLVKIGRRYIRPRKFSDLLSMIPLRGIDASLIVMKLGVRLERGLYKKSVVLYSQGVMGLLSLRYCNNKEEMRLISNIYAGDQMSPALFNELLYVLPTGCSFRSSRSISEEEISTVKSFFESLSRGSLEKELIVKTAEIHGKLYDDLIEYIKELQTKLKEIKSEEIERILSRKYRTSFDKIREIVRACGIIEELYEKSKL